MTNKIITGILTATLMAATGCSSANSNTQTTNAMASNANSAHPAGAASPSAPQASPESPAGNSVKSVYTELSGKECSPEKRTSEVSSERTCPGVGGYKLLVQNDDDRDTITIIAPDGRQRPLNFWETISKGAFATLGQKAEWRVVNRNGKDVPVALIVRLEVQAGGSVKGGSYLTVSKITEQGICVTDSIAPAADANEKARAAADSSASKPCVAGATQ